MLRVIQIRCIVWLVNYKIETKNKQSLSVSTTRIAQPTPSERLIRTSLIIRTPYTCITTQKKCALKRLLMHDYNN